MYRLALDHKARQIVLIAGILLAASLLALVLHRSASAQDNAIEFPENSKEAVATFTADDPEGATSITWGLVDPDAPGTPPSSVVAADYADFADFEIGAKDGVLKFKSAPDFEFPTGSVAANGTCDVTATPNPCKNTYKVVVTATDPDTTNPGVGYHEVTVKVTNVEETGKVSWTVDPDGTGSLTAATVNGAKPIVQFQVGATLSASVTDGDIAGSATADPNPKNVVTASGLTPARASAPIWRWYRSPTKAETGTEIDNANAADYTVGLDDVGMYLRAVAHYVVAGNVDQETAMLTAEYPVLAARVGDNKLKFSPAAIKLSVDEGDKGAVVGTVAATGNHGVVNYTLDVNADGTVDSTDGADNGQFKIDQKTGQITTDAKLDREATTDTAAANNCAGNDDTCVVIVRATDASGTGTVTAPDSAVPTFADATVTITINDENEEPVFITDSTGPPPADSPVAITVPENQTILSGDSAAGFSAAAAVNVTYAATDPESRSLTYHLTGPDGSKFQLSTTRVLSFRDKADYEKPTDADRDNVYEVTVRASDGTLNADRKVRVTVTEVDEAPAVTGMDSASFPENGTGNVATFTAKDPEGATPITWGILADDATFTDISGVDAADAADADDFTIKDGVLKFAIGDDNDPPDFEDPMGSSADNTACDVTATPNPCKNTYKVVVTAADGTGTGAMTGYHKVEVKVTNVSEGGKVTWTVDPDGTGALLVADVNGGKPIVQFQEGATLTATARDGDIAGDDKTIGTDEKATWRWFRGSTEISGATGNEYTVQVGDAPGFLRVEVKYNVGDSQVRETASLRSSYPVLAKRVPAHALKFAPREISRSVAEGEKGRNVGAPVRATGNHGAVNYMLAGTIPTTGTTPVNVFKIDPKTGQITTNVDIDADGASPTCAANSCTLTVRATDASGEATSEAPATTVDATVTIKITKVDEKPKFTTRAAGIDTGVASPTAIKVVEGNTSLVTAATAGSPTVDEIAAVTYAATDEDGLNVNLTLRGPDASKFTLSAAAGGSRLDFAKAPDYESPGDANGDNVYEVTVRASDGTTHTDRAVKVTVTDKNEAPKITAVPATGITVTGPTSKSYPENGSAAVGTYTAMGPNAASVRWTLGGADAGDFRLSTRSGQSTTLMFRSAPDYENAADSDTNNVYMVTLTATAGAESGMRAVTVTVTDVDDSTAGRTIAQRYDANNNNVTEKSEVLAAIEDYLDGGAGAPTKAEVLELINRYLDS